MDRGVRQSTAVPRGVTIPLLLRAEAEFNDRVEDQLHRAMPTLGLGDGSVTDAEHRDRGLDAHLRAFPQVTRRPSPSR